MKKVFLLGLLVGFILLLLSVGALVGMVKFFPHMAADYYNPIFSLDESKAVYYFLHPFILSFALAWFWERFKGLFSGTFWLRGLEMGLVYGLVATLPSMWITFSAIAIPFSMVVSWFFYGIFQAVVAGLVYARMNPD